MYITKSKLINFADTTRNEKTYRTSFNGKLEKSFFDAARKGNRSEQLKALHNISFDIFEKDLTTGNNFLHIVCIENSEDLFKKAKKLLSYNKLRINELVAIVNKENKTPLDYLKNESFRAFICGLLKIKPEIQNDVCTDNTVNIIPNETQKNEAENIDNLVGNEITDEIIIDEFDFDSDENVTNETVHKNGINSIVGLNELKEVFNDEILTPLKNNKNVFTNGFLLHGFSGNGKTYSIEKLAEDLNRDFVSATFLSTQKDPDKITEIINNNIIKIDVDEIREIGNVASLLKENFKKTRLQGFVFLDEIKNCFTENNVFSVKIAQSVENSAKNGMVLLATTQNLDYIESNILNSLRFEKIIELPFPKIEEITSYLKSELQYLSDYEIKILAKKMKGLSYLELTRFIEGLKNREIDLNFENCDNELMQYAQKNNYVDFSDEGSTINYDTFLKRTSFSINDPKSLDDVAGMDEVKAKLKKIFGPLKNFDLLKNYFSKNKVKRPNGILLYGPPGCGKTYIMTALSGEIKLPLYQIKISDIGSSYINESEKNIKKVFDQLRKKYKETGEPSILFFDECDTFFSKKNGNSESTQKLLNTLKEEMNNAGDDGIFIVAATNEKDDLNTAIIRDGRFDTKIEVGYPDEKARYALIIKQLNYPVLNDDITKGKIEELVNITKNLSNATITGIFSTLKYERANLLPKEITNTQEAEAFFKEHTIDYDLIKTTITNKKEEINKINLKQKDKINLDWQGKTINYDEFLTRNFYTKSDPKSLNDVIGMDDVKKQIQNKILAPLNPIIREVFKKNDLPLTSGIILHGPGGVGKTFIIKAAAAESRVPMYELKLSEVGSSYANETSKNIQNVFNQLKKKFAETGEPSILFLDECDSILGKVNDMSSNISKERNDILNTLKTELVNSLENGIIVIAATNNYKNLDPTVTRSGRFSEHIEIGYPNKDARIVFIKNLLNKRELTSSLSKDSGFINQFADITENMSHADINEIISTSLIESNQLFIVDILKTFKNNLFKDEYKINPEIPTKESIIKIANKKRENILIQRSRDENLEY